MLVIGAKGFAKELLSIIYQNNSDERICFYDDISSDLPCLLFDKYEIINDLKLKNYIECIG